MSKKQVILLTAPGCRRSERARRAFQRANVAFTEIPLASPEGTELAVEHRIVSSPGIIVCGRALNVFDLFPGCRFDPEGLKERLEEVTSC